MTLLSAVPNPKFCTLEDALRRRAVCRMLGKRFVMTNGCFDLLHPGHLYFLNEAAAQGDVLWVLLNAAASISVLKGPKRPMQGDVERAYALGSLSCVSGITLFEDTRLTAEIWALKPDVYVKAADYTLDTLDKGERAALEAVGAEIVFLPFLEGFSTTQLIRRIVGADI